jgi:hypothetical protein
MNIVCQNGPMFGPLVGPSSGHYGPMFGPHNGCGTKIGCDTVRLVNKLECNINIMPMPRRSKLQPTNAVLAATNTQTPVRRLRLAICRASPCMFEAQRRLSFAPSGAESAQACRSTTSTDNTICDQNDKISKCTITPEQQQYCKISKHS